MEDNVGVGYETLDCLEVRVAAHDSFVDAKVGLKCLSLFGAANENSDVELATLGVLQELRENSTTDIACDDTSANFDSSGSLRARTSGASEEDLGRHDISGRISQADFGEVVQMSREESESALSSTLSTLYILWAAQHESRAHTAAACEFSKLNFDLDMIDVLVLEMGPPNSLDADARMAEQFEWMTNLLSKASAHRLQRLSQRKGAYLIWQFPSTILNASVKVSLTAFSTLNTILRVDESFHEHWELKYGAI